MPALRARGIRVRCRSCWAAQRVARWQVERTTSHVGCCSYCVRLRSSLCSGAGVLSRLRCPQSCFAVLAVTAKSVSITVPSARLLLCARDCAHITRLSVRQTSYAFVLAGRDGEDELVMSMFSEKPAETKLLLTLLTFGVTIGGSFGVCWLTGSDPWGTPCLGACLRLLSGLHVACVATCCAIRR